MPTQRIAAGSHGQNQHGWLIPGHDRQLVHIFREKHVCESEYLSPGRDSRDEIATTPRGCHEDHLGCLLSLIAVVHRPSIPTHLLK